jgi:hypothetical protein
MNDVPLWLQVAVAIATVVAAVTALIASISSGVSSRAAVAAQADANAAWKRTAEALGEANELTRLNHEAEAAERGRLRRAPLGAALGNFAVSVLSARFSHAPEEFVKRISDEAYREIGDLQTASDAHTAPKFTRWVTVFATRIPLEGLGAEDFLRLSNVLAARERDWVTNPEAAMAAIRADPIVILDEKISPDDPYDYRVP